jgi:putative peptidoglycan lipid II flippase
VSGEREPIGRSSTRAVSVVTALSAVHLAAQFALQIVVAHYFGAGSDVDAYVAALTVPAVLSAVLFGNLPSALVPVYASRRAEHGEAAADATAGQVGFFVALATSALAIGCALAAGPLAAWMFPGFPPQRASLAVRLTGILCWLVVLNTLTNFLFGLFQARRRYAAPPVAGLAGVAVTIAGVAAFGPRFGVVALAWSVFAGAAMTTALLLPPLARQWRSFRFRPLPGTRRVFALLVPLALAGLYLRADPLIDRHLASRLDAGTVSHLAYAWRLATALALVLQSGLAAVAFPVLATHAAAGRKEEFAAESARALRFLTFVMIPVCGAVLVFAGPIVRLLFERGRFQPDDTAAVARLLVLYLGLIAGMGLGMMLAQACFAGQRVRGPLAVSLLGFTAATAAKFLLAPVHGADALAGVASAEYLLTAIALAVVLAARHGSAVFDGVPLSLLRSLCATAAVCGLVRWIIPPATPTATLLAALAGAAAYVGLTALLGDDTARALLRGRLGSR